MEETLKILTEFILERQTALEMENKRLSQQLQKAEDIKNQYYDGYNAQAEKLARLARLIRSEIRWAKDGEADYLSIYSARIVQEICKILRIEQEVTK